MIEKLRIGLKGRRADFSQQKITFVTQDSDLLSYTVKYDNWYEREILCKDKKKNKKTTHQKNR